MARFYHADQQPQHQPAFRQNNGDQFADSRDNAWEETYDEGYGEEVYEDYADQEQPELFDEEEFWDEDMLNEEERAILRRERWRTLANLGDFAGVIVGTAVILVLVALLISLVNWVQADVSQTFTLWQTHL